MSRPNATDESRPQPLLQPLRLGALQVPNRVFMAPLTRNRAKPDGAPHPMAAVYYGQRASGGLIISEATQISAMGKGYINTPGIHTDEHVAAWRPITEAVRAGGGRIFCQLWHVGRISHTSVLPDGRSPLSASAVKADAQVMTEAGMQACSEPVALDLDGIKRVVRQYASAARRAIDAGFDGVEVHSANGYLLDQFLQDGVNQRDDRYGGSVDNRARLLFEVLDAVCEVCPSDRVGVRLAPLGGDHFDIRDSDPEALFGAVYTRLSDRTLAYLHVVERFPGADVKDADEALIKRLRQRYAGTYIANGGYDFESGTRAIADGHADAVAYGRPFLANPDLPERFRQGADLNAPNPETFYGGGAEGYLDYPFLDGPA